MKGLFYIVILAYQISTPNNVETFVEMEHPYNTLSECRESLTKQTIVTGTYDEAVFFITKKKYRYDWHDRGSQRSPKLDVKSFINVFRLIKSC